MPVLRANLGCVCICRTAKKTCKLYISGIDFGHKYPVFSDVLEALVIFSLYHSGLRSKIIQNFVSSELPLSLRCVCCSASTILLLLLLHCGASTAAAAKPSEPAFGVLRVWNANKGQTYHTAGPDDVIVVEVKDFSGWVIRQVEIRGYFMDKAIDASSDDVKRIIRDHAFEEANLAAETLENAIEGDAGVLKGLLSKEDLAKYAKALLTSEGKWTDDETEQLRRLRGRRAPEKVIGPLLEISIFTDLSDFLPHDDPTHIDISKTLKLLPDIRACSEQLIRATRDSLHPKINDIVFDSLTALNSGSASVDQYQRPKANPRADYEWLRFRLVEDNKTGSAWTDLRRSGLFKHDVRFTLVATLADRSLPLPSTIQTAIGLDSGAPPPPDADRFFLQIAPPLNTVGAIVAYIVILAIFLVLSARTDLISDTSGATRPDGIKPYSLGRAQMAFWFLVIIGASLFLWIATGSWHILNDTCLWLIGIGSGTALGAAIISEADSSKAATLEKTYPLTRRRGEKLASFKERLDVAITEATAAAANGTPAEAASVQARLNALGQQRDDLSTMPDQGWRRLMRDWLTDDDVYSFHRYQMLAWTVVLGLFFTAKVWARWELPTFDATMLALLGITSGTYLGFKLQKNQ